MSVRTAEGLRRIDHLVKNPITGEIFAVEVKSGNATRSATQLAKDALLETEGGYFVGKNASQAGFSGVFRKIKTVEINVPR